MRTSCKAFVSALLVREILEFGKPFFFSFFVSTVHELPELLILREHHAFNVCILGNREKYRTRPSILRDHYRPIRGQFLHNLA
jgi:hypothetical protein